MTTDLLFDTPWWILAGLAFVGAVLLISGNRRQERRIMYGGMVLLLLAAAWGTMSWFVDTDREKAIKRTRAIAAAVDQHDWQKLHSLLSPNTQFAFYSNRDDLVAGGKLTAEHIGLKNVRITSLQAEQHGSLITVDVNALTEQDIGPSMPTSWRFNYNNLGTGWQLSSIEALPNRVFTPEFISRFLVRAR